MVRIRSSPISSAFLLPLTPVTTPCGANTPVCRLDTHVETFRASTRSAARGIVDVPTGAISKTKDLERSIQSHALDKYFSPLCSQSLMGDSHLNLLITR